MLKIHQDKPLPVTESQRTQEIIRRKKVELKKIFIEKNIIEFNNPNRTDGKYLLKSGILTNYYINIKTALGNEASSVASDIFALIAPKGVKKVIGSGLGGHVLVGMLRDRLGIEASYDRGSLKKHGTGQVWEGEPPVDENEELLLIDDVITKGTSVNDTYESIEKHLFQNPNITHIMVVANRMDPPQDYIEVQGKKIPIISIFDANDLQNIADEFHNQHKK